MWMDGHIEGIEFIRLSSWARGPISTEPDKHDWILLHINNDI